MHVIELFMYMGYAIIEHMQPKLWLIMKLKWFPV